jgi:hypothetical protein
MVRCKGGERQSNSLALFSFISLEGGKTEEMPLRRIPWNIGDKMPEI